MWAADMWDFRGEVEGGGAVFMVVVFSGVGGEC